MNISLFFQDLIQRGAKLWLEEDQLRCQGPGEVLTPEVLEILKQHKSEFLDLLHDNALEPEKYPLSHGQQALWFLNQDAKESASYNTAFSLRICSPLDVAAMKSAFQYLVDRHSLLRACFPVQDGKPLQKIRESQNVCFEIIDAADRSEEQLRQQVIQAYQQPFDLETGSLLRIHLFRRTEEDHVLLITVHHIIFDAWSGWLLMDEFSKVYSSITAGQTPNLEPLQYNYRDYIQWQTEMLSGLEGGKLWQYWQKKLAGDIPVLQLPTDRSRPSVQTLQGATIDFPIGETLTRQLRELARTEGTTLFTVLMAAFHVLLHRYTGQDDILVGSPTFGRDNRDFSGIAGYFVNPVVIRTDCADNPSFRSFLHQVSDTALEAIDHQDFPFPLLVERLQPKRSSGYSPLFQVDFLLQKAQVGDFTNLFDVMEETEVSMNWGGLVIKPYVIPQQEGQFDVTLEIIELENSLSAHLKYNTDLFNSDTMKHMGSHFQELLRGIVQSPAQQITALPLLTQEEQQQLLEWNQTETDYSKEETIVDLFQEQVKKTPDNIAVVFEETQLTYRELNQKANQLAHYLLSLKIETDNSPLLTGNCLVGICVERSLGMVIGLLGILKAGCAYVPLDSEYPEHRLQFVLEDSQVPVLLTQSQLIERLSVTTTKVVCLDSEWEQITGCSLVNPVRQSGPENLAYVIYTSGSTGVPKGVMVEHAAIVQHIYYSIIRYQIQKSDNVLQFASLNFDASLEQIFSTWCGGGRLVMLSTNILHSHAIQVILEKEHITIANLPPAYWQQLLNEETAQNFEQLRLLILGGEALSSPLAHQTRRALSDNIIFLNAYGPTEATITATLFEINEQLQELSIKNSTPIGQPITNIQVYILDTYNNVTPIGIPGELCIAGAGLARGYLNRSDLTAEKFIKVEVFGKTQRVYKTGDLARWLPDGNLEYLGRLDNQIKLRGFRIELGEIESSLSNHEAVKEAVVILQNKEENSLLVAYVTTINNEESSHSSLAIELRTWLKTRLPDYMVPAGFMVLDKLPLTPNGKIDRNKLQKLDIGYCGPDESYVAPRTPEEELLSIIWANVLGVERVGIHDNFFELGGHSLLATQLISRIRDGFEVEMPLRIIFEHPVFQDQAERLGIQQRQIELPPIISLAEGDPLVLSFAQQRLWFLAQLEGQSATYNMPTVLHLKGELDHEALERSMETLIKRHDSLRLCFPEVDGQATVIIIDVYNPVIFTDLSGLSDDEQQSQKEALIESHAQVPFDITTGPLFRLRLIKLSDEEHILLFNMHHIISDGWSIGVLIREWSALYSAYYCDQESELQELSIQYTDYAVWQRNWLRGEVLDRQCVYWREKLTGSPELLELPTDYPRPAVMSYRGAHLQSTIPAELTERLKRLSRDHGVTTYMTLLTAFNVLLYRYSGQEDILVGSPIANRTHRQTEELIGFFINTLVLRTRVQPEHSMTELLKQVRQTALEAYAHQDIPFEYLVEQLNPTRSLSHSPLFQVMFVLQNAPMGPLGLEGIEVSFLEQENTTTKFDLTLSIAEQGDELVCDWEYCTDLFRQETIARMREHFQILLEGMVTNPLQSVSQLPLLTETETQRLQEWNKTETDYQKDKTIVNLFQEQVEKTPDNIAVVFEDRQLTYRELNRKSNQLAHYLLNLKSETDNSSLITENCIVGICIERSLEMVIGLLGILKAGGAYVPLDPEYPEQRLQFMLEDSQVPVLLTQSNLLDMLPVVGASLSGCSRPNVVCLDSEWETITNYSAENQIRQSGPGDLAYVIYTSGSTGQPKGVMIRHFGLINLIYDQIQQFDIQSGSQILQFVSLSFDVAMADIAITLSQGGTLHLLLKQSLSVGENLIPKLRYNKITHIQIPVSVLATLESENLPDLQVVIVGGETCPSELVTKWSSGRKFINAYGPTEMTVCATLTECQADGNLPPIGKPISNTKIYILDINLNPIPLGIPGELCIAGAGLARGYLNCPDLTEEKFIEIEVFGKPQRIYKTGDLARWLPDGNLEYLGRLDHQIKLRGFRIELGEIEANLSRYDAVREAVVVFYDKDDNKRLIAYVTLDNEQSRVYSSEALLTDNRTLITELRSWLKARLPEYMVPSSFTVLDTMPLTPNGKIDRKALPTHDLQVFQNSYEAPRTDTEQRLVDVWENVLKLSGIGIHDNFFERGGDSILSIQIVARAREAGLGLSPRDVFQHQTIAALAHVVQPVTMFKAEQGLVSGEVALIPIQRAFFAAHTAEPYHFNQAILLSVAADMNEAVLRKMLEAILCHHDALRLRYRHRDGEWYQNHTAPADELPFHSEDLSDLSKEPQAEALRERADFWQASLNLEAGPLMRLVFFRLGREARLLWCIHHLVVDGVSWRILLEDFHTAYQQAIVGKPIRLPEKTSAFKVWADRLYEWKEKESFLTDAEYWRTLPEPTPLPMDNPTGKNRVVDSQHYTIRLTTDATQQLLTEAPAAYRTRISDLLLTTLMLSLRDWTGQAHHLIDLESHGRADLFDDIDLSRTVGWFTSLHTISLELPEGGNLGNVLKSIKEQLRKVPHEGVGYGVLRYLCRETLPQGQILFNYLGQFDQIVQDTDWYFVAEESGQAYSLQGEREHLIEINGQTVNGCLSLTWSYSSEQYRAQTIQELADNYQKQLQQLIDHCREHYGYTPSDFPLTTLNQARIDNIVKTYGNAIVDLYPLSPMQEGMLFHTLYAPESGVYFEQIHCRIEGSLKPEVFRQSWQHLVDRHAILRTAFLHDGDKPLQLVCRQAQIPWEYLDWRELSPEEQREQLETLLSTVREQGFELNRAPLMRIHLIRETASRCRFVWHNHHLLMDGWCLPILFTELLDIYQAYTLEQTPILPPVRLYRDYITWLDRQDRQDAQRYWQEELQGFCAPTPLPIAQHSHTELGYQEVSMMLNPHLSKQVDDFAREHRLTLNTLVQGAWAALLMRYSGESDVIFGVTTSGRHVPIAGIDRMLGLFINTLPLRVKQEGEDLIARLQTIQERQQQNNLYAYTSLVDIQGWSEVPNGIALFESLIVFENYPVDEELRKPGAHLLNITDVQSIEYTNYSLTLAVIPEQQLQFKLTYDSNRFSEESMERLLSHVNNLLEGMVACPEYALHQLPLLTETETQQLLKCNQTEIDYPKDKTIVELFQEQVAKTPDTVAVVFGEKQLTYRELNRKANQLAHYLLNLKTDTDKSTLITENCLVGICVERSLEMVIGLLGILKAGCAYVPLDPEYPEQRLQFMLEDSQVPVLISQNNLRDKLPAHRATVVYLDSEWENITNYSVENLTRQNELEHLAYVIYTSGSTGKPKGTLLTHKSLSNYLYWALNEYNPVQGVGVPVQSSIAFDATITSLYLPIISGTRAILISEKQELNNLAEILRYSNRFGIIKISPAHLEVLNQQLEKTEFAQTAYALIIGGEALTTRQIQPWLTHAPQVRLINEYGPTESVVGCCIYDAMGQTDLSGNVPIGRPIANTKIYILDDNHNPTPLGIPGELCIAGAGLARGYLNRPELTAEKFVKVEVFGESERLYKTGDLARWLPNGNLEFLGRLDHQIKLRGFRIELGEIESSLSQHQVIREVVVVYYDKEDNPRLVAYVTLVMPIDDLAGVLRAWIKDRLPEYMVPSGVTVLDTMPLTPNGKIDRKALQLKDIEYRDSEERYLAPRIPEEELLSIIWANVLGVERVGIHDNFFELGGHSLLATQLASRIRERFEVEMPLRIIFEHPVFQDQAEWLGIQQRQSELPPIIPLAEGDPLVLSFAQQRLWFLVQLEGQSAAYNMPAALHLKGELDHAALERTMDTLIKRHDSLRMCFPEVYGEATVEIIDEYNPLTFTDLSGLSGDEQESQKLLLIESHAQVQFDITSGPLLSLHLVKLSNEEHVLLFNMHHIISDGWSIGVLIREWSELYSAYHRDREAELLELSIQYTDYAVWQRNWLRGEVLDRQCLYWQEKLSGAPAVLELPTDFQRPAVMSYRGEHLQSTIPAELTERVKHLSREQGVTLYMTLLTAFSALLYRYSGQEDILVGSPIANRTQRQTEDLIGFFVNTLVLRTRIQSNQPFCDLMKQVRQTSLEAYAHQDIPFEYLIEQLNPTRSLSHAPLFQVMFVLQNAPMEDLDLEGLNVSFLEQENTMTKFDLTLSMIERGDELVCDWEYCTDLFHRETIGRMTEHFHILLDGMVANPLQSIAQLPLLTGTEMQLLQVWNQTETDYPKDKTIVDLFQEQVEKTPDNIAVVFEDRQLTYRELNQKANQLAHYLLSLKSETDNSFLITGNCIVGICNERSLEMVIGLLGILKAGCAYVPLDQDYPGERLAFMIRDSGIRILITQSNLQTRLFSEVTGTGVSSYWAGNQELIIVTIEAVLTSDSTIVNSQSSIVNPQDLAYVIYTSGSTGKPKGVGVPHQGVIRLVRNINYADFGEEETFLQFAPISFDASSFEIWGSLLNGSKLYIVPPKKHSLSELSKIIQEERITILWQTSSLFNVMIDEQPEGLVGIKQLLVGGEKLSVSHVQRALSILPETQIMNGYGPTENTTFTSCYPIQQQNYSTSISIGKPIANTTIYVLDKYQQLLPIGVVGELYAGGSGLARGYLNRPELTAEKFIEVELFGQHKRLYKTGDLARWLPDGNLEYLGRFDHQVKLRGFRIELGEIEATLGQHEAVKEAVVVLYDKEDNFRLAAYVTLTIPIDKVAGVLSTWLKARLPEYMVPSGFTVLDTMPLTPNGKINRKALPAPDILSIGDHYHTPRDTVELQLLQIWEDVLQVRPIGINDNFFELGGHSLLAVKLMSQIQQTFDRHLPIATLFQSATIVELAIILRSEGFSITWSTLVPIQPKGSRPPLFCLPGAGGNVLYLHNLASHLGNDQPCYGFQPPGLDGKPPVIDSVEALARYHLTDLRSIQPHGPYYLAGHSFGGRVAFELASQLEREGEVVALIALFDTGAPYKNQINDFENRTEIDWLMAAIDAIEAGFEISLKIKREMLEALEGVESCYSLLFQRLKQHKVFSPETGITELKALLTVFRTNCINHVNYLPKGAVFAPITLFRAEEILDETMIDDQYSEPDWGWNVYTQSEVNVTWVPGNHSTLLNEPHVKQLAAQLQTHLNLLPKQKIETI